MNVKDLGEVQSLLETLNVRDQQLDGIMRCKFKKLEEDLKNLEQNIGKAVILEAFNHSTVTHKLVEFDLQVGKLENKDSELATEISDIQT